MSRAKFWGKVGLIYAGKSYSPTDFQMRLLVNGLSGTANGTVLAIEIPSFEAGLVAFLMLFLIMGIMFYVLRTDRGKIIPKLNPLGPNDMVRSENPLSVSDAPFLAIITLVILELVLDALIVISAVQGMGSAAVGAMLALAAFIAAGILAVYRSTFMDDAFTRKPRLEIVSANLFERSSEGEKPD